MRGYEKLLASGLPVSWNVICTGSREGLVSREDLQAHACDQLGRQSGDTGYLVFLLFDADPTNYIEIVSLLERLAEGERGDSDELTYRNLAERTWNVAVMRDWLGSWPRDCSVYTSDDYDYWDYYYNRYLPFPDVCDFDSPSYITDAAEFDAILTSLRKWVGEEEATLRREAGRLQSAVD